MFEHRERTGDREEGFVLTKRKRERGNEELRETEKKQIKKKSKIETEKWWDMTASRVNNRYLKDYINL